jgi:hypothetical protein
MGLSTEINCMMRKF